MSQVSLRVLKLFMVVFCLGMLAACGPDKDPPRDVSVDCRADKDCESFEQCTSNNTCVERTSCSDASQCKDGKACIDSQCVVPKCTIDDDCTKGSECKDSVCVERPRQCTAVGQSCSEDRLPREGFTCVDLGEGLKCQEACKGGPGVNKCSTGSICVDRTYCKPSECAGPAAGQEVCDAKAEADKTKFPNGASCAAQRDSYGNEAFACVAAGKVELGEECSSTTRCKAGLLCVPGLPVVNALGSSLATAFCAEPCDAAHACSQEGESCIGASKREFSGGGICGDRCDPFKAGQVTCSDDSSCIPVTSDDGICTLKADNTVELYSKCDPKSDAPECPSGTWCFGVTAGEARCLPLCDPTLAKQNDQNATCPTADPKSFARIAHLAEGIASVDVFLGTTQIASGLSFGALADNGEFIELPIGTKNLTVRLAGETEVVYTQSIKLDGNDALNITIVNDAESLEAVKIKALSVDEPRQVPAAEAETTELRVVHAISDLVAESLDVVLVRAGEDIDEAGTVKQRLGTGVAYGKASDFNAISTAQVGGATGDVLYDVYFFKASETTYVEKVADLKVTTGQVATIYLIGTSAAPAMQLVEHSEASKSRILGGYCLDLTQGRNPKAGLGVCFENCTNNTHIGAGVCSGGGVNACDPRSPEQMWCFPSGQSELGGACKESSDCADGLFCDENGAGSGTCRSYCEHKAGGLNPALSCQTDIGEICVPKREFSNLGECRIGCDGGTGYKDESCPESQKSCFGADGISYCQGSGTDKIGEECADPAIQSCVPGAVCAKRVPSFQGLLLESFSPIETGEVAYCRELCKPFLGPGKESGCSEGFACSPLLPGPINSVSLGHCVESGPTLGSDASCTGNASGKMCGDNAYCVEGICVRVCDAETKKGCLGNEQCRDWDLLGLYGRCQ